jgi:hypothetical protein
MKSPLSVLRYLFITSFTFFNFINADISFQEEAKNSLKNEGKKLAKKYDLEIIGDGLALASDISGSKDGRWALSFTSKEALTIDEARPIIMDISYKLLYSFYHDPTFSKYYQYSKKEYPFLHATMDPNEIGFRLAFWNKDVNRPLYPYLAQVRLADSKIYYHYADPETQALQPPIVESLESLKLPDYK